MPSIFNGFSWYIILYSWVWNQLLNNSSALRDKASNSCIPFKCNEIIIHIHVLHWQKKIPTADFGVIPSPLRQKFTMSLFPELVQGSSLHWAPLLQPTPGLPLTSLCLSLGLWRRRMRLVSRGGGVCSDDFLYGGVVETLVDVSVEGGVIGRDTMATHGTCCRHPLEGGRRLIIVWILKRPVVWMCHLPPPALVDCTKGGLVSKIMQSTFVMMRCRTNWKTPAILYTLSESLFQHKRAVKISYKQCTFATFTRTLSKKCNCTHPHSIVTFQLPFCSWPSLIPM